MSTTRAKFKVSMVSHHEGGSRSVVLVPVTGPGNEVFWKYTPSGRLEMGLSADCKAEFAAGQLFHLDFTPIEE